MIAFEQPLIVLLNRLLGEEPWARERLAPFAGQTIELRFALLPALRLTIVSDGHLRPASADEPVALAMRFGADVLPALLKGEDHLLRAVETNGDARLANEVLFLFRHLRWDVEEDLARVLGDATGHRIAASVRQFVSWNREALLRVAENVMEHALEERKLLAHRREFEAHRNAIAQLRDALERIEKRLDRIAG